MFKKKKYATSNIHFENKDDRAIDLVFPPAFNKRIELVYDHVKIRNPEETFGIPTSALKHSFLQLGFYESCHFLQRILNENFPEKPSLDLNEFQVMIKKVLVNSVSPQMIEFSLILFSDLLQASSSSIEDASLLHVLEYGCSGVYNIFDVKYFASVLGYPEPTSLNLEEFVGLIVYIQKIGLLYANLENDFNRISNGKSQINMEDTGRIIMEVEKQMASENERSQMIWEVLDRQVNQFNLKDYERMVTRVYEPDHFLIYNWKKPSYLSIRREEVILDEDLDSDIEFSNARDLENEAIDIAYGPGFEVTH
jgi:hypothetical protein